MSTEVQFSIKSLDGRYSCVIAGDTVLGRDSVCDAVIPESSLSRKHARFFLKDKALYIEDLGSTNGTFVNGQRLEKDSVVLRYNDVVRFDLLEFKVFVELATPESAQPGVRVVSASSKNEKQAPRSWAVNDEIGHGTVVMDLGARKQQASEPEQRASTREQSMRLAIDKPSLIGLRGVDQGKTITLELNDKQMTVWQIGRSPEMDIVIEDPSVSEHQAQIIFEQGTWKLVDVISTNATYVNGEKILTHYLSNGDSFSLGATEYLFRTSTKTDFRPRDKSTRASRTKSFRLVAVAALILGLAILYFLLMP